MKWLVGGSFKLWDDEKKVIELVRPQLDYYCLLKDEAYVESAMKVPGVLSNERVAKRDLLRDVDLKMIKLKTLGVAPLKQLAVSFPVWEADVRASDDFLAFTDRVPGMPWDNMPSIQIPDTLDTKDLDSYLVQKWFRSFETVVPKYEMCAVDIETHSVGSRLANPREAEVPIIAVSVKGFDGKGVCFLLSRAQPVVDLPVDIPIKVVDSEFELLTQVFAVMKMYPMVFTYNGDEFDLPYMLNRGKRLGMSDYEMPMKDGYARPYFESQLSFDLLRWFDNQSVQIYIYATKYKDMDLNSVSLGILGRGKIQHQEAIGRMTLSDLARYCWNDADLTLALATYDDQYTMMMMTYMSRMSGLFLEDVCRYKVGSWITNIICREHRRQGALIPNRGEVAYIKGIDVQTVAKTGSRSGTDVSGGIGGNRKVNPSYEGALVFDPIPGVHWNVGLFDFASLYPTIIETWNLGYATLNCCHKECEVAGRRVPDLGYWICGKMRAIEANFIEVLRALRVRYYKPLSKRVKDDPVEKRRVKAIEGCLKVVMNASYGVFGSDKFSFFYPKIAESIAHLGRFDIITAREHAKLIGMKVLYGDTDSIFLEGSKEQGQELIAWTKQELNLDFEFADTFYWLILTDRKKNYMGLQESDGKVKVMGLVGKKRNTPTFIRATFDGVKKILSEVKTPAELEARKKDIAVMIYSAVLDLRHNVIPLDAMAVTVALSKDVSEYAGLITVKIGKKKAAKVKAQTSLFNAEEYANAKVKEEPVQKTRAKTVPQHVRVALMLGLVKAGSIVRFVKVKPPGKKRRGIPQDNAKPVEMVQRHELDLDSYEDLMKAAFAQILESIEIPWPQQARQVKMA